MIPALTLITSLAVLLTLAREQIADALRRWPVPREGHMRCDHCDCSYRAAAGLAMHVRAQHPSCFEELQ